MWHSLVRSARTCSHAPTLPFSGRSRCVKVNINTEKAVKSFWKEEAKRLFPVLVRPEMTSRARWLRNTGVFLLRHAPTRTFPSVGWGELAEGTPAPVIRALVLLFLLHSPLWISTLHPGERLQEGKAQQSHCGRKQELHMLSLLLGLPPETAVPTIPALEKIQWRT